MPTSLWMLFLLGLAAVLIPRRADAIAVMSVDLGSEWMKIGIVSPGVPMEIVLNKESKRKTPVAIAFRDGERLFGEDAANLGVRFPKNSYNYLLDLLGKRVENPIVQLFRQRYPYYDIVADPERGTVLFQHDSENSYSPEQLLSMLLGKAKEFAEEYAQQPVNDAVLTVPGYFNQAERRALLQAAELAGIKVLQLMNDYTAVALNYGIFRRKDFNESAQYIMFYDMGASSTTATIVSYQIVKTKEKGFTETNPQLAILGVGYDRTLGGLDVQLRLRDYLAKKFNEMKKTPNDIFKNPRAMAKLFKEAGRLKNVLSANAEHHAQVEGVLDDHDFKLLVTREHLEEMCSDLFDRVKGPVEQALKTSSLDIDVISQVILVGAGTRIPKVQERLTEIVGMELGKNINTDEAAAMGAVYKAADLSTGFKVKKFLTKDAVILPIQVVFEREVEGQPTPKQVRRILFGPMNPYPQKKVLTFNKHQNDFTFHVNYAELDHLPASEIQALGSLNLSKVDLTGVEEGLKKNTGPNVESKGIKAHFTMDESGLLTLANVELVVEKTLTEEELAAQEESPLSKLGSTISKLFTGGEEEKKEEPKEEKPDKASQEGEEEVEKENAEEKPSEEKEEGDKKDDEKKEEKKKKSEKEDVKNATKPSASSEKKPKVVVIKEPIATAEEQQGVPMMSAEQLQEAKKTIEALDKFDREKQRREGAQNALESFVFDLQNKLETEEYQVAATEEEADNIKKTCLEMSTWLDEEGFDADADTYEAKLLILKTLTKSLFRRVREHQDRPEVLAHLDMVLNASTHFLVNARNMSGEATEGLFTPVELETLEKVIRETEEWKSKMLEEQAALKPSENPKLTVKSILEKTGQLDREVKYLVNKAKIWKPKKLKENKDTESSKNETEDTAEPVEEEIPTQAETEEAEQVEEVTDFNEVPVVEDQEDIRSGSGEPSPELPEGVVHTEGQEDEKGSHTEL